jgi:hypothetical protein
VAPNREPDQGEPTCGNQTAPEDRTLEPGRHEQQPCPKAADPDDHELKAEYDRGVRQRHADQMEELVHSQVAWGQGRATVISFSIAICRQDSDELLQHPGRGERALDEAFREGALESNHR